MDPLVDESIEMAKKLKKLGNSVQLNVLPGLPHGFLNFIHVRLLGTIYTFQKSANFYLLLIKFSEDANEGNRICINHLAELFDKL